MAIFPIKRVILVYYVNEIVFKSGCAVSDNATRKSLQQAPHNDGAPHKIRNTLLASMTKGEIP